MQEQIYQGGDWWEWAVWIDGSDQELDSIASVIYTLHPTFRNPVRRVDDRVSQFRLDAFGWGTFTIYIEVRLRGGSALKLEHDLELYYPDTEKRAGALIRIAESKNIEKEAESLHAQISEFAPEAKVETVAIPIKRTVAKHGSKARPTTEKALSVDLTGPSVATLSASIESWLRKHKDVRLELVSGDGSRIAGITVENIADVFKVTMDALRK
jgi:transcription initiation factor IIF auxiliary subunit